MRNRPENGEFWKFRKRNCFHSKFAFQKTKMLRYSAINEQNFMLQTFILRSAWFVLPNLRNSCSQKIVAYLFFAEIQTYDETDSFFFYLTGKVSDTFY